MTGNNLAFLIKFKELTNNIQSINCTLLGLLSLKHTT